MRLTTNLVDGNRPSGEDASGREQGANASHDSIEILRHFIDKDNFESMHVDGRRLERRTQSTTNLQSTTLRRFCVRDTHFNREKFLFSLTRCLFAGLCAPTASTNFRETASCLKNLQNLLNLLCVTTRTLRSHSSIVGRALRVGCFGLVRTRSAWGVATNACEPSCCTMGIHQGGVARNADVSTDCEQALLGFPLGLMAWRSCARDTCTVAQLFACVLRLIQGIRSGSSHRCSANCSLVLASCDHCHTTWFTSRENFPGPFFCSCAARPPLLTSTPDCFKGLLTFGRSFGDRTVSVSVTRATSQRFHRAYPVGALSLRQLYRSFTGRAVHTTKS